MIEISKVQVYNLARAVYSARNALNSWARSDSDIETNILGPNDLDLAKRLSKAGSDDRKFMRSIIVCFDMSAPMYMWKEFDTYKVGTVRNSCSTMHKITAKEFTESDFSFDHLADRDGDLYMQWKSHMAETIKYLNAARSLYLATTDTQEKKNIWWQLIQSLPSSYNQLSTITLNYEVLKNMYNARKAHKLDEWRVFCSWIKTLPYSGLITGDWNE